MWYSTILTSYLIYLKNCFFVENELFFIAWLQKMLRRSIFPPSIQSAPGRQTLSSNYIHLPWSVLCVESLYLKLFLIFAGLAQNTLRLFSFLLSQSLYIQKVSNFEVLYRHTYDTANGLIFSDNVWEDASEFFHLKTRKNFRFCDLLVKFIMKSRISA